MNKQIQVLFFGSLVDVSGAAMLSLPYISQTDTLLIFLKEQYPSLTTTQFFIAVNHQMIQVNTPLNSGDTVALMPPFSGG